MRGNKNTKLYILGALLLGVASISLGFAAFSNTLRIQSQANVTPNEDTFKVVFSSNGTTYKTDPVTGTITGSGVTTDNGIIDNTTNPTITGLHASFKSPGQKVVYNFFVHNMGEYLAYLNSITFKGSKTCIAGSGASESLVNSACSAITMKVEIGSLSVAETTQNITGETIAAGEFKPISVTIEYASNGSRVDGPFSVTFPDVSLYYGSAQGINEEVPNQILYAFGDRNSNQTYTDYNQLVSSENKQTFIKYEVDGSNNDVSQSVCLVLNGNLGCFKNNNYDQEKSNLQTFFGASNCTVGTTGVDVEYTRCNTGSLALTADAYGDVKCIIFDGDTCKVSNRDRVSCTETGGTV